MSSTYTQVDNQLLRGIANTLSLTETRAMLYLLRHTAGYHRKECLTSYGEIAKWTGMARRRAVAAIDGLTKKGLITITTKEPTLRIQVDQKALHWRFLNDLESP